MTYPDAPKAGRREWVGLAVLAFPTLLVSFDVFVLLLALPHLAKGLGADSNQQLWVMDIYGFMLAGFLLTMGNLGDRIGRRKLLMIGAATFGAASVLSAYSTSPLMLIGARALLGIAGATLTPSTLALISNMFHDPKERATAISMWGGTWMIGAIVGPIVGGILLERFWWGSVFLLGVPAMVLLLVLAPVLLPEYRNPQAGPLDWVSVALSLTTLLPVIYGIKQLARNGWQPLPAAAIVVGVAMGAVFLTRQRKVANPLLDLRMFRISSFSTSLTGLLCYSLMGGATMLFMTQYFQLVGGLSPLRAGLAMVPGMVAGGVGFGLTPVLASKIRPAYLIAGGLACGVVIMLAFTQIGATSGSAVLVIGFALFSLVGVPLVALGTNLVVSSVPPEKAGPAGSLTQLCNEFGGTLGAALLGTVGFAVYRQQIGKIPAGVPAHAAGAAHDSMAGAAAAAAGLPHHLAAELLAKAHDAFTAGLHAVTGVNAVILALLAILIVTRLRHIPPIGRAVPAGGEQAPAPAVPADTPVRSLEDALD